MIFVVLFLLLYTSLTYQIISAEGIIYVGFSYVGDIIFDVKYRLLPYCLDKLCVQRCDAFRTCRPLW